MGDLFAGTGEVFISEATPSRRFGQIKGRLSVGDDFNDPLPDDLLNLFEGVENLNEKSE